MKAYKGGGIRKHKSRREKKGVCYCCITMSKIICGSDQKSESKSDM